MQAVILAAGRGTRMDELTTALPKAMIDLDGKPLLEYKLDALPSSVNEVIVVIGYLSDAISSHYGGEYHGKKIRYAVQQELNGTAGALWSAKDMLEDRFMVLNGDDIFTSEDLEKCAEDSRNWKLLVQQMPEMHRAGAVVLNENAKITDILEGDRGMEPGLASTNSFTLDKRIFTQQMSEKEPGSHEYGLPQTVIAASKVLGVELEPIFTLDWIQINYPADLTRATLALKNRQKT